MRTPERIIISRTDSIGDVMLTLPVAGMLKKHFPSSQIIFMGRSYTKAIIESCSHVDSFLNYDELETCSDKDAAEKLKETKADTIIHVFPRSRIAKISALAGIRYRIGTTGRIYHWLICNKLVAMSRKRSDLHEAQLNLKLLKPLGIVEIPELKDLWKLYGLKVSGVDTELSILLDKSKVNVILHPGSRGSGREWGVVNFSHLAGLLNDERYKVFLTGTEAEGKHYGELLKSNPHVTDLCGKADLPALIHFISKADVLVAASTGPLHIAAATGIHALGLYAPMRPIHPGRWAPVGKHAKYFVVDRDCSDCRKSNDCHCIREITAGTVARYIHSLRAANQH